MCGGECWVGEEDPMLMRFTAAIPVKKRRHVPVVIYISTLVLNHPGNISPHCCMKKMR